METSSIQELILKYNNGLASPVEVNQIEKLLEDGTIDLMEIHSLSALEDSLQNIEDPAPSSELDLKFYQMLSAEKKKAGRFKISFQLPSLSIFLPRLAFTIVVLAGGFLGGFYLNRPAPASKQVAALSEQVDNLQEMVMLSLLEKESASERLRAVSLTSEMDQASKKVTTALLQTLNNDNNINVRLAALDALRPYVRDNNVRAELIRSISKQDSPLMQVALAELMRDIQEKKSVQEFNKILKGDKMPDDVKRRIKEKIQVLI